MGKPKDNGGLAFPASPDSVGGITLRDWFASQEKSFPPQAWLECHFHIKDIELSGVLKHEALSKWRYEMADAMLAARKGS